MPQEVFVQSYKPVGISRSIIPMKGNLRMVSHQKLSRSWLPIFLPKIPRQLHPTEPFLNGNHSMIVGVR
jgi:hypothetical protein